jgi:hypothetical protein
MNRHYNQNYSREQIASVLDTVKDCVRENRYSISKNENRQENIDFIQEYQLTSRRQREILLRIAPEDFCHTLQNTNLGFEYETLYVFVRSACFITCMVARNLLIFIRSSILSI